MDGAGSSFSRRLVFLERLSYTLLLLPFLTDFLETGRAPRAPRQLITESLVGLLILAFVAVLRRTRKEIERLEELKQSLTLAILHDLKNPMTTLLGSLQHNLASSPEPQVQRQLLEVAARSCERQIALAGTLLDAERHPGRVPQGGPEADHRRLGQRGDEEDRHQAAAAPPRRP